METEYANALNQYPTIFIPFAGAKGELISIVETIKYEFRREYDRLSFVFNESLTEFEIDEYNKIKKALLNTDDGNINNIRNALSFLMKILEKYYDKKVMVFIDEYDTSFIEAYVGGFYEEIKDGLLNMLHNALKTSTSLQYAMLTGIQRVAKENIFSDLNNLVVCTVADERYSKYFGFSEEEKRVLV